MYVVAYLYVPFKKKIFMQNHRVWFWL